MFIWIICAMEYRHLELFMFVLVPKTHIIVYRSEKEKIPFTSHYIFQSMDYVRATKRACVCVYVRESDQCSMLRRLCFVRISVQIDFTWLDECCTNRLLSMSKWYIQKAQISSARAISLASRERTNTVNKNKYMRIIEIILTSARWSTRTHAQNKNFTHLTWQNTSMKYHWTQ